MRVGLLALLLLFLPLCTSPDLDANAQPHLDSLRSYAPTAEVGHNEGPYDPVIRALRFMGFGAGTPYCAATVSLCLEIAGVDTPKVRTALATDFIQKGNHIRAIDVLRGNERARPGDVVVWRRGNGYHGHAGIVDSTWTGRCGWTVEANTMPGDHNEEYNTDGIYRRYRCIRPSAHTSIVAFVRWDLGYNDGCAR